MKIPVTMPAEQRKQMLELLIAQNNLTLKIKETNNKEISEGNGDTAALAFINQQIVALTEQEATREVYMNKMGNVQKIVDTYQIPIDIYQNRVDTYHIIRLQQVSRYLPHSGGYILESN